MSSHRRSTSSTSSAPTTRAALPGVTSSGRAGRSLASERLAHRMAHHRTGLQRTAGGFAAMAVVGATLSLAAPPGEALPAAAKPRFAGYSSTSTASPLKIEVYEPTIPLPAEPQLELSVGYSAVVADSASSRSRASYLWPGAPVGEGFKTIADQLMLPEQIGETGYPVQVNAVYPGGPAKEADEPGPGMVQRASAAQDVARADNGVSTDGEVEDGDGTPSGDGPVPGVPGLPDVPGLPALPGLSDLSGVSDALTGSSGSSGSTRAASAGSTSSRSSARAPAAAPALAAPLAALVDVGTLSSTSSTDNTSDATVRSRAAASDITLLGGVVTIEDVRTTASASSNGTKGTAVGRADFGDIVVAGQRFTYGSGGFEAAGTRTPVPGLPAQGVALLKQLGVTISVPKPVYTIAGDAASVAMPGLKIELDLKKLRSRDGGLASALNDVLAQLPGELDQVKSPLQAAIYASPRVVLFLGTSYAGVDTSEAIAPPPIPAVPPVDVPDTDDGSTTPAAPSAGGGGGETGAGTTTPVDTAPVDPTVPVGDAAGADEAVTPVADVTPPGLPPLLSFPGLLLYGGLLGAGVAGFFVRRLGGLALGATGSCAHGLTSGLPDLRKA